MAMKTDIEIVTGFLGAGKTTFINALVDSTILERERLLVLLCENGNKCIRDNILRNDRIIVKDYDPLKPITARYIKYIIKFYNPHRIIIEYNGTRLLEELFMELNEKDIRELCDVSNIFHITDANMFHMLNNGMSSIIKPYIFNSNMIIINNIDQIAKEELDNILKEIEVMNPRAYILSLQSNEDIKVRLKKERFSHGGVIKSIRIFLSEALNK